MEELKNEKLENKKEQEKTEEEIKNKKNTFTLIYILVGIVIIAIIAMLLIQYFVTK